MDPSSEPLANKHLAFCCCSGCSPLWLFFTPAHRLWHLYKMYRCCVVVVSLLYRCCIVVVVVVVVVAVVVVVVTVVAVRGGGDVVLRVLVVVVVTAVLVSNGCLGTQAVVEEK